MKRNFNIPLTILSVVLFAACAIAGVPLKWTVETSRVQPATFDAYQGETLTFEAALQSYGKPLAAPSEYAFYWQTNGMGSAWWVRQVSITNHPITQSSNHPISNVLYATFSPDMDVGAKVYSCFIGLSNSIYRAAFQLRLRPSPGAIPNEIPLPVKVIDFSKVTVLNPPWPSGSARPLPRYLHYLEFDDTYPEDAAWYYAQPQPYGSCSAVRDGGFLYRNYDWHFDFSAEFVVRVSAGLGRFASIGVANCGTNLNESFVTSGKPSRYYKCLPGRVVDGINENGVVCEINVVDGEPQWGGGVSPAIHPLAAVRWALDNGTSAGMVASNLAARIKFPSRWTQNFHWMVADAAETWIVENGAAHLVDATSSSRPVMTNFRLYPSRDTTGAGQERYNLLVGGGPITNAWFTCAYSRSTFPPWESEFKDASEMEAAMSAWETHSREQLRGKDLWQTVHCSIYDITNRILRIAVQEQDDWYTFSLPGATGVSSVGVDTNDVSSIVDKSFVGGTNAVNDAVAAVSSHASQLSQLSQDKRNKTDFDAIKPSYSIRLYELNYVCKWKQDGHYESEIPELAPGNTWGFILFYEDGSARIENYTYWEGGWHPGYMEFVENFHEGDDYAGENVAATYTPPQKLARTSATSGIAKLNTDGVLTAATPEDFPGLPSAADVSTIKLGLTRLYNFSVGATNANFSVTNYPPTAAEAEGRTHFDPTDPDLDFSTVPASMRLDETRDGAKRTVVDTRDFPVWWWVQKAPKLLASAKCYAEEKCAALFARLSAWADRTARGLENPAGESTLVIDVPNIWLMTDQTFEKHVSGSSSCWVIRSKNAAISPNVTTNGFLELTDAFGTPYIRFNKTEATFADPPESGIYHDDQEGEWIITYETKTKPKGGANLALQGSETYPGKAILKDEDDELCPAVITWTGSSGHWLMHAKPKPVAGADLDKMFFGAVVEIEGQDYIEYLNPVSFSHIVMPNGKKIAPDVPAGASAGTTVSWKVVE